MGTWITHIRIAENILDKIDGLDPVAFAFGNLAPDSGKPNEDWSKFDPSKMVTHFFTPKKELDRIRDLDYYREFLSDFSREDNAEYSFRLGYFCHLICDNLWKRKIGIPTTQIYNAEISENRNQAWEKIKLDWYTLDQQYLIQHPKSLYWQSISIEPNPPKSLPFLIEDSLNFSLNFIRDFYNNPDSDYEFTRRFPYLNNTSLNKFVEQATTLILKILLQVDNLPDTIGSTSLAILADYQKSPFNFPLGDEL
jgi:hypothetical protein